MFGAQPILKLRFLCICTTGAGREVIRVIQEEKGLYISFSFFKRKTEFGWIKREQTFLTGRRMGDKTESLLNPS